MKSRLPEASRLEADYLSRVRESLRGQAASEVDEIIQSLQEHIEEELAPLPDAEVTLVQMANVLEQLGPPESYMQEETASAPEGPAVPVTPDPGPAGPSAKSGRAYAELLDKIWVAYLIAIIGLYIPVIDFPFCNLIGSAMLAFVLLRIPAGQSDELRAAGKIIVAEIFLSLFVFGGTLLSLAVPAASIVNLPFVLAQMACAVIAYWKIMGHTADVVTGAGHQQIARTIYSARTFYIIYVVAIFVLATVLGVILALAFGMKHGAEAWWLGLLLLPLSWIFGWLLILRPLGLARNALRG